MLCQIEYAGVREGIAFVKRNEREQLRVLEPVEVEVRHARVAQNVVSVREEILDGDMPDELLEIEVLGKNRSKGGVARLVDRLNQLHDELGSRVVFVRFRLEWERDVAFWPRT